MARPSQITPAIIISIKLAALSIALAAIYLLINRYGFQGWKEYAAIALGVLTYVVTKAVLAAAVGYVWGRRDARELKQHLADLSPQVKQDVIDHAPPDVKGLVANILKKAPAQRQRRRVHGGSATIKNAETLTKKPVTDLDRLTIGLNAAAYMCWVETRKGASPSAHETQGFIKGFLDAEGFAYAADEPRIIELSALAFDIDKVHAFIKENHFFNTLDQAQR